MCTGGGTRQSVVERLCPQAANYFGLCSGWADRAGQTHRGHPKNHALRRQAVAWEVIEMSVYTFPPFRTHVFASGPPLALVVVCDVVWHVTLWEVGARKHTHTQTKTEGAATGTVRTPQTPVLTTSAPEEETTLPGRLGLPALRFTASRCSQLRQGSLKTSGGGQRVRPAIASVRSGVCVWYWSPDPNYVGSIPAGGWTVRPVVPSALVGVFLCFRSGRATFWGPAA